MQWRWSAIVVIILQWGKRKLLEDRGGGYIIFLFPGQVVGALNMFSE